MNYLDIREEPIGIFYPTNDYRSGRMELYFPDALDADGGLTIPQLRRFFKLCLQHRHDMTVNEQSVHALDLYLTDYVLACKDATENMGVYVKNNLQNPKAFLDREERKHIKEQNTRLYKDLKETGKRYERSVKILTIWNEMKTQYV